MILQVCDRFHIDPDHAGQLDASTIGLLKDEQDMRQEQPTR